MTDEKRMEIIESVSVDEAGYDATVGVMGQWGDTSKDRCSTKLSRCVELAADEIRKQDKPRVIDIGCFEGYTYDWLKKTLPDTPFEYSGFDIDPEAIIKAASDHQETDAKYFLKNLYTFTRQYADIAICSRVLIHVPDVEEALRKILLAAPVAVVSFSFKEKSQILKNTVRIPNRPNGVYYHRYVTTAALTKLFADMNIVCDKVPRAIRGTHSMVIRYG
jgi:2-polyprenyl-3-methyl-5-hydroxy-6-metoxy-1,4-benzoquinol methylase